VSVILPGSTIGILGGGQLGRMVAMAARALGYRVQAMDPDPSCPARFVVDACFEGGWNDARAAADLARGSDVVTLEIEQISQSCLEAASRYAPLRPGPSLMKVIQNRITQKQWLADAGFPLGPWTPATTTAELEQSLLTTTSPLFVKSASGGYDGRSQVHLPHQNTREFSAEEVWQMLGGKPCVVEQEIPLEQEVSVMVARSPRGEVRCYPSARNHHERQILVWSVMPSSLPAQLEAQAREIASDMADALQLEGILAVEMFLTTDGRLLVNELAPRPHNSYHASEHACDTSQFEQCVRAICNLPLGDTSVVRPAAIANLLGDLWLERDPRFDEALSIPGVHLHLYEKHTARAGRKMGHLSATGATPDEAIARVVAAYNKL
jgi:5-(carboxyamino)imidazole ribonucleotide synthase